MKSIIDVYKSVAAWNALRYEQQLDLGLAVSLLREEYQEWKDAKIAVNKLDALCDISYVALGVAWKCGGDLDTLISKLQDLQLPTMNCIGELPGVRPVYLLATCIDTLEHDYEYGVYDSLAMILHICAFQAMYDWQLTPEQWIKAMEAVCVSNDSKVPMQVAANVKANAGNKGPDYVSPAAALTSILNNAFLAQGRSVN